MTVTNAGPHVASDVRIVNQVGNQLALTGITCVASGGALCPEAPGPSMTVPTLPPGGVLRFDVSATVGATGTGSVTITNTMSATITDDVNRSDNTFTAQVNAYTPNAAVSVVGAGPGTPPPAGGTATFVMTVSNAGPDVATAVHIVNTVGGNQTLSGLTCSATGGATCPTTFGPAMDVPTLPAQGTLTFYVSTVVGPGINGTITNTLSALPDNDPDRTDNTAVAVGAAYSYNVSVAGTPPTGPILAGQVAEFTMVVTNNGPGTALDVGITNTVGDNLTLGSVTCTASGGATCPAAPGASMVVPTMPPDGVLSFTVPATVAAGASGTVSNAMSITGAGDSRAADNSANAFVSAVSTTLGVSQTGPATVSAGTNALFVARVANPGPGAATNLVITQTLTAGLTPTITCTAAPGATCPTTLGPVTTVPSLPAGRWLTFTYQVPVPGTTRGDIVSTVQVQADVDADLTNNLATVTALAIDARNGTYKAYATDGQLYELTVDFDARQYTMSGNGHTVQKSFTENEGEFSVGDVATARFRVAQDLLVGGHDFGRGVLPYVAARRFSTSVNELGGVYNVAARNVAIGASTRPGTARVTGNVLQLCETDLPVVATQNCGLSLRNYVISLSGDLFTGVETLTGETFSFRLARTGAAAVLLSAGPAFDGSQQFRIGLRENAGLTWGVVRGATTTGDWVTITLDANFVQYSVTGTSTRDNALLRRISNAGPFGMVEGTRTSDGATIYVMQTSPLVVVTGAVGGPADGLLQIALP